MCKPWRDGMLVERSVRGLLDPTDFDHLDDDWRACGALLLLYLRLCPGAPLSAAWGSAAAATARGWAVQGGAVRFRGGFILWTMDELEALHALSMLLAFGPVVSDGGADVLQLRGRSLFDACNALANNGGVA